MQPCAAVPTAFTFAALPSHQTDGQSPCAYERAYQTKQAHRRHEVAKTVGENRADWGGDFFILWGN